MSEEKEDVLYAALDWLISNGSSKESGDHLTAWRVGSKLPDTYGLNLVAKTILVARFVFLNELTDGLTAKLEDAERKIKAQRGKVERAHAEYHRLADPDPSTNAMHAPEEDFEPAALMRRLYFGLLERVLTEVSKERPVFLDQKGLDDWDNIAAVRKQMRSEIAQAIRALTKESAPALVGCEHDAQRPCLACKKAFETIARSVVQTPPVEICPDCLLEQYPKPRHYGDCPRLFKSLGSAGGTGSSGG